MDCDFYQKIWEEEDEFLTLIQLMEMVK